MSDPWVQRLKPREQPRLRLFAFGHAGGGASTFRTWADAFGPSVEVAAVQLPGREGRHAERAFTSLPELVPIVAQALSRWMDRPFVFFGHSLGALLSFDLTRHLRATGARLPGHLFVSGRNGPHVPNVTPHLHALGDAQFLESIERRYRAIPAFVRNEPDLLKMILRAFRADLTMVETRAHREEAPLSVPITAFAGDDDPHVDAEGVRSWSLHTTAEFRVHPLRGDHFYYLDASCRPALLQSIREAL